MDFDVTDDDRFEVVELVGSGGMAIVYRGRDRKSGAPVALKVAKHVEGNAGERFAREARVLAMLEHPGIVEHVGQGLTTEGLPYLAMEWLDGEDLAHALARRRFTAVETVTVGRLVCEALAAAHAAGVIHRDIKPSNIFLVGGDVTRVKVLDFGVARPDEVRAMTVPGAMLGTAGYMAPEQVRDATNIDARVDVFAVGCVLYECFAGRPAFEGSHPLAIIAKLLVDEVPRLAHARPEIDPSIDALVARAMAKDKDARPRDAQSLLEELDGIDLGRADHVDTMPPPPNRSVAQSSERELVSAILVRYLSPRHRDDEPRLVGIAERHDGTVSWLDSSSVLLLIRSTGEAVDQAARAAQCALALRSAFTDAVITVGTGGARTLGGRHVGPAIDNAVGLLDTADGPSILLDDVTEGLLDPRFERRGSRLLAERTTAAEARVVLGRPTPCVGRRKELDFLESTLDECIEQRLAQAVVVTAPQGIGKSRLRHEFAQRVNSYGNVRVLEARGAGSALGLARQLVLARVSAATGDPGTWLRAELRTLPGLDDPDRVADFLGELAGITTSEPPTPQLRAAQDEPRIMAEWTERSFVSWISAEARKAPLLIVIEDLHWGDQSTVSYLGRVLREPDELQLMVFATARPEVHGAFPNLSTSWAMHELPLRGLHARDALKLARAAAGEEMAETTLERLVRLADGNAFFLEELVRHASERGDSRPPPTVLACVEARLGALPPEARRVVRAASVFGERFWDDAIAHLLGTDRDDAAQWLDKLEQRELVEHASQTRFVGERERFFRHALFRAAAYASLADDERAAHHVLAGEWLEMHGERDARILLDHFDLGDDTRRAGKHAVVAAETALAGMDLREALGLCVRGLSLGVEGIERARLLAVNAMAACWTGRLNEAIAPAGQALELAPVGSATWNSAVAARLYAASTLMRPTIADEMIDVLSRVEENMQVTPSFAFATTLASKALAESGRGDVSEALLTRLASRTKGGDPASEAWYQAAAGWAALCLKRDVGAAYRFATASSKGFESVGDALGGILGAEVLLVHLETELGDYEAVMKRPARALDLELGCFERICQVRVHLERRDWDAALDAAAGLGDSQAPRFRAAGSALAARAWLGRGEVDRARELSREAISVAGHMMYSGGLALLSAALSEQAAGEHESALVHADRGTSLAGSSTLLPSTWLALALVRIESLDALRIDSHDALRRTSAELSRMRDGLPVELRDAFLSNNDVRERFLRRAGG